MSLGVAHDGGDIGGVMRPVSEFFGNLGETIGTDRVGDTVESGISRYDDWYSNREFTGFRSLTEDPTGIGSAVRTVRIITGLILAFAGIYVLGQLFNINLGGS